VSKNTNPNTRDMYGDVWLMGSRVEVRNNDIGRALRKFKKKVQDDGILQDLRQKEFYEKPSIRRKKAKAAARSRWLKKLSQSKDM
jgi:small subunit ribosomal protein S21